MLVKGVMFKHLKVNVYELNQNKKICKIWFNSRVPKKLTLRFQAGDNFRFLDSTILLPVEADIVKSSQI